MGDIGEPQCDPLASTDKEEPQSSPRSASEQSKLEAAAATDISRPVTPEQWYAPGSASLPAYVQQAVREEGSRALRHRRASSPLQSPTQDSTSNAPPDDIPAARADGDTLLETIEDTTKLDKGKGRARSRSEPAEASLPQSSPDDDRHHQAMPVMVLRAPSGTTPIPQAPASEGTQQSVRSLRRSKQIYSVSPGSDDYPHVTSPRSINRRGALPYQPRQILPQPRGMHNHRQVTSYAGEPLFRLCKSVPYVLGPRALITRLQLIVETPIFLPDEVKHWLAANKIDAASLDSHDTAMLHILCCLWND